MRSLFYTLLAVSILVQAKSQTASQTKTSRQVSATNPALWSNLNVQSLRADDADYAYIKKFAGGITGHVFFSNFDFEIPPTATINNITLTVRKFATGNVVNDNYVSLLNGCCSKGPNLTKSTAWPVSEVDVIYTQSGSGTGYDGNPYTWSAADINNTAAFINHVGFGVIFHAQKKTGKPANIYLEQVTVRVDYTTPQAITSTDNKTHTTNDRKSTEKKSIEIRALPNEVVVTTPTAGKYFLIITDLVGRKLEQKIIYTTENSPTVVSLDKKFNGVYFITCTGNGSTKTIKSFLQ